MSNVIVIAGKKQSGKSSLANFLYGFYLTRAKILKEFTIDDDGKLIVPSIVTDESGQEKSGYGILDLQSPTQQVADWAAHFVWPHIKDYAFGNLLKMSCIGLFGLTYDQCFGSKESKDSPSKIKWKDACKLLSLKDIKKIREEDKYDKNMSAREVLQFFGTDICRTLFDSIWIDNVFNQIQNENPKIAVITDCRYKNEVLASKEHGAKIIKLERNIFNDTHTSETDLDDLPPETFDLIINNQDLTIKDKNYKMYDSLVSWGLADKLDNIG